MNAELQLAGLDIELLQVVRGGVTGGGAGRGLSIQCN